MDIPLLRERILTCRITVPVQEDIKLAVYYLKQKHRVDTTALFRHLITDAVEELMQETEGEDWKSFVRSFKENKELSQEEET